MHPDATASSPRVLDAGLELLFLQIAPGYESDITRSLKEQNACLYWKAIGKYDLICLHPFEREPSGIALISQEHLPKVLDHEHLVLFLYESEHNAEVYESLTRGKVPRTNWLAVTMLKLNLERRQGGHGGSPIQTEHKAFRELEEVFTRAQLSTYVVAGGLGWFSHVALVWSDDLNGIVDAVLTANRGQDDGPFLKSLTVFGLSYSFIEGQKDWGLLDSVKSVGIELLVTCRSDRAEQVLDVVRERFQAPLASLGLGSEEVVGECGLPLSRYFDQLLKFRKEYGSEGGAVWATNTRLNFRREPPSVSRPAGEAPSEPFSQPRKALSNDGFAQIVPIPFGKRAVEPAHEDTVELHRRFSQMYLAAVDNPLTCDAYIDMVPALKELTRRTKRDPASQEQLLREVLIYLNQAYQQRSLGTLNSPWGFGNPVPLFYRGGVHRALWAAEGLIHSLFQEAGQTWTGFAVFGVSPDYLRSHLGIITLPLRVVLKPEEWWGVFHEAGHEFFYRLMQAPAGQALNEALKELIGDYADDQIARQYIEGRIWEAVSDVFDYEFGFLGDWDLYRRTVTEYLVDFFLIRRLEEVVRKGYPLEYTGLGEQVLDHLAQLLTVYIHHVARPDLASITDYLDGFRTEVITPIKERIHAALRARPEGDTQPIGELGEKLDELLAEHRLEQRLLNSGCRALVLTDNGRSFLSKVLPGLVTKEAIEESWTATQRVLHGEIPTQAIPCPQLLIREMKRAGNVSYRGRVAAILTLWNLYAERLPDIIGSALGLPEA